MNMNMEWGPRTPVAAELDLLDVEPGARFTEHCHAIPCLSELSREAKAKPSFDLLKVGPAESRETLDDNFCDALLDELSREHGPTSECFLMLAAATEFFLLELRLTTEFLRSEAIASIVPHERLRWRPGLRGSPCSALGVEPRRRCFLGTRAMMSLTIASR